MVTAVNTPNLRNPISTLHQSRRPHSKCCASINSVNLATRSPASSNAFSVSSSQLLVDRMRHHEFPQITHVRGRPRGLSSVLIAVPQEKALQLRAQTPLPIDRIRSCKAQVPHGLVGSVRNGNAFKLSTSGWHFGSVSKRTRTRCKWRSSSSLRRSGSITTLSFPPLPLRTRICPRSKSTSLVRSRRASSILNPFP